MPTKQPSGEADDWLADYATNEKTLRLVHPAPMVDFSHAIERTNYQVMILPTQQDCTSVAALMPDFAFIAWGEAKMNVSLQPLYDREKHEAFLWLANDKVSDWLGEQLSAAGYTIKVIRWPGRQSFDLLTQGAGSGLRDYCVASMAAWKPLPQHLVDVIPDLPMHEPVVEPNDLDDILSDHDLPVPGAAYPPPVETPPPSPPKTDAKALQRAVKELAAIPMAHQVMGVEDWMGMGMSIVQGKPVSNVSNISLLFDHIKPGEIWYDTFLQRIRCMGGDGKARDWTDADDIRLTIEVQRQCGIKSAAKGTVSDAVIEFAMRNCRNELQEYVEECGRKWDKVPRMAGAFKLFFECEDTEYTRKVSSNFFKSLVRRAMTPGSKVDTMIVLEGEQGIGKSTVLEKIGGPYYAIMRDAPDSKDFAIVLAGKWLIEIAELHAFSRSDVASVKRTMTTSSDRYRMPYGVHAEDHKRMSVFAGTVNQDDWNKDPTGARRFWPIRCKAAHSDLAEGLRDLLVGEALHAIRRGETHWEFGAAAEEALSQQDARYVEDDWTQVLRNALVGRNRIRPHTLYEALGLEVKDWGKATQMRVAEAMRRMEWRSRPVWLPSENKQVRMWCNVNDDPEDPLRPK